MFEKLAAGLLIVILGFVFFMVVSLIAAIPTYFLWNWLMPEIFAIKAITFWQAWGVNFLTATLFKNSSYSSKSKG